MRLGRDTILLSIGLTPEVSCGATRAGPQAVYARRSPRQLH